MPVTNRISFLKKHNLPTSESYSLEELSKVSGFPVKALEEVGEKGLGAYHSNYQSVREKGTYKKGTNAPPSKKLSPEQWSAARIYAFLNKSKKVFYGVDKHIAQKYGLI